MTKIDLSQQHQQQHFITAIAAVIFRRHHRHKPQHRIRLATIFTSALQRPLFTQAAA